MIAALGLDGVRAPLAFPGSTDTAAFQTYVEQVLVPALHEGDVVVFDNLKPHLAAGVAKAIEGAGRTCCRYCRRTARTTRRSRRCSRRSSKISVGSRRGRGRGSMMPWARRCGTGHDSRRHHRLVPTCRTVCNTRVNRCRLVRARSPDLPVLCYQRTPSPRPQARHLSVG